MKKKVIYASKTCDRVFVFICNCPCLMILIPYCGVNVNTENLSNMVPDPLYSMYHYSHPPLLERLRAIDQGMRKRK